MKNFVDIYNNIPKENLEELNELRSKEIMSNRLNLLVLIFFIVATIINFAITKFIIIFEAIILFASYKMAKLCEGTSFSRDYEKYIIKPIVESYNEDLSYDVDGRMSEDDYLESGYGLSDEFYSSSYFETKDKKVRGSDIAILSERTNDDGQKYYSTIFSGIYTIITLDNYSQYTIKMSTDSKLKDLIYISNKRKVEVDSAKFEENFDLFCENRVYAMEIFTSEVLNQIIALAEKDKTKYEFVLKENKLYVRYYKKDIFESNVKEKIEMKNIEKVYDNIYKLLDLLTLLRKDINEKLEEVNNKW